jgi:hypothetical protein
MDRFMDSGIFVLHNCNTYGNQHDTNKSSNSTNIFSIHAGVVDRFGHDDDDDDDDVDKVEPFDFLFGGIFVGLTNGE